uniref:TNFR-Cys domain-containing protein n=2 Tax=Macrostomum lignano TaxID=282301 RepID=A0A1I8G2D2_9PLAT
MLSSSDPLVLALVALMVLAGSQAQDAVSKQEAAATRLVNSKLSSAALSPSERTKSKALELCLDSDSSMTCAWLLLESEYSDRVSRVSCMNEAEQKCAKDRILCSGCDSCDKNFTSRANRDRVKCYCACNRYSVEVYECDQRCDATMDCALTGDEDNCIEAGDTAGVLAYLLAASWDLLTILIAFAVWLGVGGIVVLIYYRMRARGYCGASNQQQQPQQQVIYQPQPPPPQQPLMEQKA